MTVSLLRAIESPAEARLRRDGGAGIGEGEVGVIESPAGARLRRVIEGAIAGSLLSVIESPARARSGRSWLVG